MLGFGSKYLIAALAGAGAIISIWTHGYSTGADGKAAAVAARDIHWQTQIQEANDELDAIRRQARQAADRTPPTPAARPDRVRLCEQSPTCRKGS
jgi:hypothetical protein